MPYPARLKLDCPCSCYTHISEATDAELDRIRKELKMSRTAFLRAAIEEKIERHKDNVAAIGVPSTKIAGGQVLPE